MRVRTVLLWEGAANLFLALIKLSIGLITGSIAILGDALHSLTDLVNNIIALFIIRVAENPPDLDHPYGHHKFEQLAVFVLASLLTVIAFQVGLSAVKNFDSQPAQSRPGLIMMLVALSVNVIVTLWERYWAKKLSSNILYADSAHTMSDILVTIGVITGWQLSVVLGWSWADPVCAVLVAIMVLYLAYDLFRRAIPVLVDSVGSDADKIIAAVNEIPEVRSVVRVRSRRDGQGVVGDIVVTMDSSMTLEKSHVVADAIEALLAEQFGIEDATVHVEPDQSKKS